jgi:V/A-type H+-transporting ATPase subunit I
MNWYPEQLAEIQIEVPERFARKVTEVLGEKGIVHIEDVSYLSSDQTTQNMNEWQLKATDFADLENKILAAMKALKISKGEPTERNLKMLSKPEHLQEFTDQVEQEINAAISEITESKKEIDKLRHYVELITPFTDLDIPFDGIRNRRYLYSILGTMPPEKIDRFKMSMENIPFTLLELKRTGDLAIVLLLGTRQHKDYLRRTARSAYLNSIDLPDEYQGTPAEIINVLETRIADLQGKLLVANENVDSMRATQEKKLQAIYWHVHFSKKMAETMTRYGRLRHGYLIFGWVPNADVKSLEDLLHGVSSDILIDINPPKEEKSTSNPPILLDHKGFFAGFQKLVTTYGLPGYSEIDPTLLIAITFPLLFGAMFGDLGQGLLLALVGVIMMIDKIKIIHRLAKLGSVVLMCGISAMVFGLLYGSVFGIDNLIPALWQKPMANITSIILITIGGGAVLLSVANILSIINFSRKKKWAHLLFNGKGLAGLILYWSILGLVLSMVIKTFPIPTSIITSITVVSAMLVFISGLIERLFSKEKPLFEHGALTFFIQSFFELFETLLSYFSNSLSFVRVGAFAVAHAGLSSVFFILAEMVSPAKGFGYWLVVVIGNLFILGFEGMIVSIQTLRLQYYEFFSKFFSGGGKRYTPFQIKHSSKQGAK